VLEEGVRVFVDLAFLVRDLDTAHLVVDEVYRGFGQGDVVEIAVGSGGRRVLFLACSPTG